MHQIFTPTVIPGKVVYKLFLSLLCVLPMLGCAPSTTSQPDAVAYPETASARDIFELMPCPPAEQLMMCSMEFMSYCPLNEQGQALGTVNGNVCKACSEEGVEFFIRGGCTDFDLEYAPGVAKVAQAR